MYCYCCKNMAHFLLASIPFHSVHHSIPPLITKMQCMNFFLLYNNFCDFVTMSMTWFQRENHPLFFTDQTMNKSSTYIFAGCFLAFHDMLNISLPKSAQMDRESETAEAESVSTKFVLIFYH